MEEGVGSDHFDVVVVGTGIAESIAAATLAKAGHSVLHLDENEYYGGSHASLTLDELICCKSNDNVIFDPPILPEALQRTSRRYALSLFPGLLPSTGPLIDKLIASDVGKYVTFRILDGVLVGKPSEGGGVDFRAVPVNKESVFKDKTISLADKRKLMKFLMNAIGDPASSQQMQGNENLPLPELLTGPYGLPSDLAVALSYGVAHCSSDNDPALATVQRMGRYLRSVGRYGSTGFLVAQYGGAGEIAQAFCRSCAVYGGTYVLGEQAKIAALTRTEVQQDEKTKPIWTFEIPAHPRTITTSYIIGPGSLASDSSAIAVAATTPTHANCVAVFEGLPPHLESAVSQQLNRNSVADQEEMETDDSESPPPDVLLFVLPPGDYGSAHAVEAVRILCMGSGTGSCPDGQVIVYVQAPFSASPQSPADTIQSYLALLGGSPLFTACYTSSQQREDGPSAMSSLIAICKPLPADIGPIWVEGLDWQASEAERLVAATGLHVPADVMEGPADQDS